MFQSLLKLRSLFSRKDKIQYLGLLLLMIVGAFFDCIGLGMIPALVSLATSESGKGGNEFMPEWLYSKIPEINNLVYWSAVVIVLVFLIKAAFFTLIYNVQFRIVERHRVRIASTLFSQYMKSSVIFHASRNSAELLRNVSMETTQVVQKVIQPFLGLVLATVMTIAILALLFATIPMQSLVTIIILAASTAILFAAVRRKLDHYGIVARDKRKDAIKSINEGLSLQTESKIFSATEFVVHRFVKSYSQFCRAQRIGNTIGATLPIWLETFAVIGLFALFLLMVSLTNDSGNLLPQLTMVAIAMIRLRQTTSKIMSAMSTIQFALPSVQIVSDELRKTHVETRADRRKEQNDLVTTSFQRIDFDRVQFAYPGSTQPAIDQLTLKIHAGESVAFVGPTGSGKSTALNLLIGLIKPNQGNVMVDGLNIHKCIDQWHRYIGYVPQNIVLLDDSIKRNVAFGFEDDKIDDDRVWQALKDAQIGDFVRDNPKGLDLIIGERGARISGGQRQRIGLARALYSSPKLLILDEGTSALDSETEARFIATIRQLSNELTVVYVAHRISTIVHCDRIFYLNDGVLEAAETHERLIASHAGYRRLTQGFVSS